MPDYSIMNRFALLIFISAALYTPCLLSGELDPDPALREDEEVTKFKAKVYAGISAEDEQGFVRMGAIKKGQWLASRDEYPQTLDEYQEMGKRIIRPTEDRRTIVIQPLGAMKDDQKNVLAAMKEYAEAFFQLPVRMEEPRGITAEKHNDELVRFVKPDPLKTDVRTQYLAEPVLKYVLLPKLPKDAVVYLGITMEDLTAQDLNYVFGLGSLKKRVGIYSLCRYYPEFYGGVSKPDDARKVLLRSCKILNHETAHLFGLSHCVFYDCSMNGTNSLEEADAHPIHFCPICQRKLQWNLKFNQEKQFEDLAAFYKKYGFTQEAEWIEARSKHWKQVVANEEKEAKSSKKE